MKPFGLLMCSLILVAVAASAHEGNDHVRGVVAAIAAHSITLTTGTAAKPSTAILTIDEKTVFKRSGASATVSDLKVGDRVVVDVPEHTTLARLVQFGPPAKATR